MSNQTNEVDEINKYLGSFMFFSKNRIIKAEYDRITMQETNRKKYSEFISNIKNNDILNNDTLNKNPQKALDFFLNKLHKKLQNKEEEDQPNKSNEINKENAFKIFKKFMDKDKSYISENFFGIKMIAKKCFVCHMTQYLFKYLKTIPINVEDMENDIELNLEKCFKKLIGNKTILKEFCPICSTNQDLEISFEITKLPKIMIFILIDKNNTKFRVEKSIGNKKYNLIGAQIMESKSLFDIFNIFKCQSPKASRCEFIQEEQINKNDFMEQIPLVLFYQKKEEGMLYKNIGVESKDFFFLDNDIGKGKINNINNFSSNDNIFDKKDGNDNLISNSKENQNTEEDFNYKEEQIITLYFRFEKNGKELYIDIKNTDTFSKIIQAFKSKYDLDEELAIDENKLFFKGKKLEANKTPKYYKINSESTIVVK